MAQVIAYTKFQAQTFCWVIAAKTEELEETVKGLVLELNILLIMKNEFRSEI